MGRPAYWNARHKWDSFLALGDANRGERTWPLQAAVSNLERPVAPTPPSDGPF